MRHTTVHHFWRNTGDVAGAAKRYTHGVSLHSHTNYSHESLEFVPKYARKSAWLARIIDFAEWRYRLRCGNDLDFSRAYWTPPLTPKMAVDLESGQIRDRLGLPGMVSLTDHDNCAAGMEVNGPISMEWTIPFPPSFLHLGVHNLPAGAAAALEAEMNAYTKSSKPDHFRAILPALSGHEDVLVVLNHPLWDEGLIGDAAHTKLVETFLERHGNCIHALELNGLRPSSENRRVLSLAASAGLPAVSGGDRHGREPNANLNLTRAATFAEFVHEVRRERISVIVYMPQYREPLRLRQFETAWDILRYDRHRADCRKSWCDRVFFTGDDGIARPLSFFFGETGPKILVPLLALMRVLEQPAVRPVLRAVLD